MKRIWLGLLAGLSAVAAVVCFVLYFHFNKESLEDYEKSADFYDELSEECTEKVKQEGGKEKPPSVDFNKLQRVNEDLVYYLVIEGTKIKYPVVQGKDNDYYLKHMFNKEKNLGGSIFLDYRCDKNPSQGYSIIYGHRMKDDSMFGTMDKFLNREYLKEHSTAWLLASSVAYKVQLTDCLLTDEKSSVYSLDGQAGRMVFSTCAYEGKNNRIVLLGSIVGMYDY